MNDIKKDRFLTWLMFAVPIFFLGWPFLLMWTVFQMCRCEKEEDEFNKCELQRKKTVEEEKEKKRRFMEYQIELCKKYGWGYFIVNDEVQIIKPKNRKRRR